MATLKDVAKLAGVSVATASFVINGKAESNRISEKTVVKVMEAVKTLAYKPNLSARRLKASTPNRYTIALYWSADIRTAYMARILMGLREQCKALNFDCDLVICLFETGMLQFEEGLNSEHLFDAAIIGAISNDDLDYLKSKEISIPVVLFNRLLDDFMCVTTEYKSVTEKLIQDIKNKGLKDIAVFKDMYSFLATSERTKYLASLCDENDIKVHEYTAPQSYEGGYKMATEWALNPTPFIFAESDLMAIGASHYFFENGIHIPNDVMLISVALSEISTTQFSNPPLTVIAMPTEEMTASAIDMIHSALIEKDTEKRVKFHELSMIDRGSF